MPKINIKATLKGREDTLVSKVTGTINKEILRYTEEDGTKMSYNYKTCKLIRDTKDLRMTFDFDKEKLVIKQKDLNVHFDIKIELIRLEREENNVEIQYVIDNTHEKETMIYRIEELKWVY